MKLLRRIVQRMSQSCTVESGKRSPVVILGSTATGKSKLAIELALKFDGEVISADSMQVYKGLDILTNKATMEEMKGVKHHMIGKVDRKDKYDVVHFRDDALPLINSILSRGKTPFIVGGTNYYIESLLWEVLISNSEDVTERKRKLEGSDKNGNVLSSIKQDTASELINLFESQNGNVEEVELSCWTNQVLYSALQGVDPERASVLHPNDRRKVIRSLQVRFQTGKKHSELIKEQTVRRFGNFSTVRTSNRSLGGPLRFPASICLWIQADRDILSNRIEQRVENMVELGLKQELDEYMDILRTEDSEINYGEGILQSIGFKEFHLYLQLKPKERESEEGKQLFREGLERLKIVTRQYAKKQLKWIRQRFIVPHRREVPPVYALNGDLVDAYNWEKNVLDPAVNILNAHFNDKFADPILSECLVVGSYDADDEDLEARLCEVCDHRVFIGKRQFSDHMKSAKHWKMAKRKSDLRNKYQNNNAKEEKHILAATQELNENREFI